MRSDVLEGVAALALGRRRRAGATPRFGVAALGLGEGGAQADQFLLQFVEARALAQARLGRRHRAGGDRKAVPAPHRAVARHQALALDELRGQRLALRRAGDDADLRQAPRQEVGPAHERRQRLRAVW